DAALQILWELGVANARQPVQRAVEVTTLESQASEGELRLFPEPGDLQRRRRTAPRDAPKTFLGGGLVAVEPRRDGGVMALEPEAAAELREAAAHHRQGDHDRDRDQEVQQ